MQICNFHFPLVLAHTVADEGIQTFDGNFVEGIFLYMSPYQSVFVTVSPAY